MDKKFFDKRPPDPSVAFKEINESLITIAGTLEEILFEFKKLNEELKNHHDK